MSIRFQIINTTTNPDTILATYDVPNAALSRLQAIWSVMGPGTAAENAQAFMLKALRAETERLDVIAAEGEAVTAVRAAVTTLETTRATEKAAFAVDFPVVP